MSERHERARRDRDETTCDDVRPAVIAAAATCGRCTPGASGLCGEHRRKRRVMIRNSHNRYAAAQRFEGAIVRFASNPRGRALDEEPRVMPRLSLREVL